MKPVRQLWFRTKVFTRAVLSDLFGEDSPGAEPGSGAAAGLAEIQAGLAALAPELAVLAAREQQIEAERRRAGEELAGLDARIDVAVGLGDDDRARDLLDQRLARVARLADLDRLAAELSRSAAEARESAGRLRRRLAETGQRAADLSLREQTARALEDLARQSDGLERGLEKLQDELAAAHERAARIEDRAAARRELGKGG